MTEDSNQPDRPSTAPLTAMPSPPTLLSTDEFRTPVYGTVFAGRTDVVHRLRPGDSLILVPDSPGVDDPNVWVHARGGDVIGHLRPDIGESLAIWMLRGGRCAADVAEVGSDDVASWRRLVITVRMLT